MTDPFALLRAKFVARCAEDLLMLQAGLAAPDLRRMVHRIAGASGMFGYDALGDLGRRIDDRAHAGQEVSESDLAELNAALEAVARERAAESED